MIYTFSALGEEIEKSVRNLRFDSRPTSLYDPIKYILSIGGKRLRPAFVLMAANLFSEDTEQAMKAAIGIEIFHNFTLLHDDLMDKSDMRRGNLTVHKKWNDNAAVLSGDAMLIEAYKHIAEVPKEFLYEVLKQFSTVAMEVCQGQQLDMEFETRNDVTVEEYMEMIRLKTAVLLASSLKIGSIIGNASPSDAESLYQYGIYVGLAFQIKDDLLDVYGDLEFFGKKIGGDIVNNKKTYLLIKALEKADEKQRKELLEWIEATDFDREEKILSVKKVYDELNIREVSEGLIEKYYLAALESLSAVSVPDTRKQELVDLAGKLMHRNI